MNTPGIPKEMAAVMFAHGHLFRQHVSFKDQVERFALNVVQILSGVVRVWVLFRRHMSSQ